MVGLFWDIGIPKERVFGICESFTLTRCRQYKRILLSEGKSGQYRARGWEKRGERTGVIYAGKEKNPIKESLSREDQGG
jgi:hypothetical protein